MTCATCKKACWFPGVACVCGTSAYVTCDCDMIIYKVACDDNRREPD